MESAFLTSGTVETDARRAPRELGARVRRDRAVLAANVQQDAARGVKRGLVQAESQLRRGEKSRARMEEGFLASYVKHARETMRGSRHFHFACDSSRVGGRETEFACLYSVDKGVGAWCAPQDRWPRLGAQQGGGSAGRALVSRFALT